MAKAQQPVTTVERILGQRRTGQARYQERYRTMKLALRAIRVDAEATPRIRALADEALRGTQE